MMKQIFYHGFLAGRFCRYKRFMADTENWCYTDTPLGCLEKKLKNILFRIYIIFDFIIFLSAIICPFIFFTNHLSFDVSFDFALLFLFH